MKHPISKTIEHSEIVIPEVMIKSKVLPNKLKVSRPPPPQITDAVEASIDLPMALEKLRVSLAVNDDTI